MVCSFGQLAAWVNSVVRSATGKTKSGGGVDSLVVKQSS